MRQRIRKVVLIERDSVVFRRAKTSCVTSWNEFDFWPRALDALRLLAENGIAVIIVSNHSCVKEGCMTKRELDSLLRRMLLEIALSGGIIEKVHYCPHAAHDDCSCQSRSDGLWLQAMTEGFLIPARTCLISAEELDMQASERAGCRGILLRSDGFLSTETPDQLSHEVASNLYQAAERIVRQDVPRLTDVLQGKAHSAHRHPGLSSLDFVR